MPTAAQGKVNLAAAYVAYKRDLTKSGTLLPAPKEYQAAGRQRQLDTLLHLSHFSDYLVLVTAPVGAGKSTFVQQFMRVQPTDTCVLHIAPTEELSAPRLVRELMAQLPIDTPKHASLEASILAIQDLSKQLVAHDQVLLILVDDAHWLDDEALELLANILPHSSAAEARPHVVLFAEPQLVSRLDSEQYSELRQERYYQLSLAPFTQAESLAYLQQLVASMELPGDASIHAEQLHQLYAAAGGMPGYLEMLLRNAIRQGGLQQQARLPVWHMLAIVIVLLGVMLLWWFNRQAMIGPNEGLVDTQHAAEQVTTAVLEEVTPAIPLPDQDETVEPVPQATRQPLPVLEPIDLSPQPEYKTLQPEESQAPTQTAPKPKLVDPQQAQVTDQLLANNQSLQAQLQAVAQEVAESAKPQPQPIEPPKAPPAIVNQPPYSSRELAFMALPAEHYSLQVLGARYQATAKQFVARLQGIALPNYVLKLKRGGEDWYVVLLGNFDSAAAAKGALGDLPRQVRDLQPWSRQVGKLQQQLAANHGQ